MSDPVKQAAIEDVLSSIRRLVAEESGHERAADDGSAADAAPDGKSAGDGLTETRAATTDDAGGQDATAPGAGGDALILTAALRVVDSDRSRDGESAAETQDTDEPASAETGAGTGRIFGQSGIGFSRGLSWLDADTLADGLAGDMDERASFPPRQSRPWNSPPLQDAASSRPLAEQEVEAAGKEDADRARMVQDESAAEPQPDFDEGASAEAPGADLLPEIEEPGASSAPAAMQELPSSDGEPYDGPGAEPDAARRHGLPEFLRSRSASVSPHADADADAPEAEDEISGAAAARWFSATAPADSRAEAEPGDGAEPHEEDYYEDEHNDAGDAPFATGETEAMIEATLADAADDDETATGGEPSATDRRKDFGPRRLRPSRSEDRAPSEPQPAARAEDPEDPEAGKTAEVEFVEGDDRFEANSDALIDEETLRDMVAMLVREELQGALGERITRNVRKLVRREIHRVLASRDFE